jgi:hypothetical protein
MREVPPAKAATDPVHQRILRRVGYVLAGVLAPAPLLAVYRNAVIIPAFVTYAATLLIPVFLIWLQYRLKITPLVWRVKGRPFSIRKLGLQPILFAAGLLFTLWLPRFVELWGPITTRVTTLSRHLSFFQPRQVLILVAEFDGPDPQNYRVTQNIVSFR